MRSFPLKRSLGRIKRVKHLLNRHWLDYSWILRFLSLADYSCQNRSKTFKINNHLKWLLLCLYIKICYSREGGVSLLKCTYVFNHKILISNELLKCLSISSSYLYIDHVLSRFRQQILEVSYILSCGIKKVPMNQLLNNQSNFPILNNAVDTYN